MGSERSRDRIFILGVFQPQRCGSNDADGEMVQPHEVSHLFEPILVKMNGTVNLLVGDEIPTD